MKVSLLTVAATLVFCSPGPCQSIRIIKLSEAKTFQMGKVRSLRVVQPDIGARRLTLNYSASETGYEFSQHVHDHSDDTILVLTGAADLRQGDTRRRITAGTCAFVPAGQIHGTITTAPGTLMISTQTPPDLALYTGARDSSRPGAAAPEGVITPGAVRYISFENVNGFFVRPGVIGDRVAVARREIKPGQEFTTGIGEDGEQILFVYVGAIAVRAGGRTYAAGERDTAFITGPQQLTVHNESQKEAVVFEVQAPPAISFPEAEKALESAFAEISAEQARFTEPRRPQDKEWVKRRLEHLFNVDQKARNAYIKPRPAEWNAETRQYYGKKLGGRVAALDRANTAELKELLKLYHWFTVSEFGKKADADAWLLVQHSDLDVLFQQEVLAILTSLYPKGETSPGNYANLWDRVAHNTGKPQRYGTQGHCTGPGKWEPYEIEDPANLDQRRASVSMSTLAEYLQKSKDHKWCP